MTVWRLPCRDWLLSAIIINDFLSGRHVTNELPIQEKERIELPKKNRTCRSYLTDAYRSFVRELDQLNHPKQNYFTVTLQSYLTSVVIAKYNETLKVRNSRRNYIFLKCTTYHL